MIHKNEAAIAIIDIMPEAKEDIQTALNKSAFAVVQLFTQKIKQLVADERLALAEQAMKIMDKIYGQGDQLLQLAVEHTFIFSLRSIAARTKNPCFWGCVPMGLYTAYIHQIYRSNI